MATDKTPVTKLILREELRQELKTHLEDFRKQLLEDLSSLPSSGDAGKFEASKADRSSIMSFSQGFTSNVGARIGLQSSDESGKPVNVKAELSAVATGRRASSKDKEEASEEVDRQNRASSRDLGVSSLVSQEDLAEEQRSCLRLRAFLKGDIVSYFISSMVMLNAGLIGAQANYIAMHGTDTDMPGAVLLNHIFFVVFFTELILRIIAFGCKEFFIGPDFKWNIFDSCIVLLQASEEVSIGSTAGMQTSFLRILRIARIARIARLARVIHLFVELRTMISSIFASLKPLFWAALLFLMLIYGVAVALLDAVNEWRIQHEDTKRSEDLLLHFSDLGTTIMRLWQCISGGIDWREMSDPLVTDISPLMGVVFCAYVAFSMLAMMNVITGIFVDNATTYAQQDKDTYVVKHVLDLFKTTELNANGEITWEGFSEKLGSKELQELFAAVDVDVADAESLFRLIDTEENGAISADELMNGWMRLRGPAKALDQSLMFRELSRTTSYNQRLMRELKQMLTSRQMRDPDAVEDLAKSSELEYDEKPIRPPRRSTWIRQQGQEQEQIEKRTRASYVAVPPATPLLGR
mmetsp:Transcript_59054/g.104967  ORF Transcript_59054/g.104967 Transcript_59054/m.104967 type:complete len:580 (-) Transcript_59054:57-1796(-)